MSINIIPSEFRNLRACLLCSLVKTMDQFYLNGCENCENFLHLTNDRTAVETCTSANFEGLIALMQPSESWVARWQRTDKLSRGVYAMSVTGTLSKEIQRELRHQGINYRSRDTSQF